VERVGSGEANTVRIRSKDIALAPLTSQFWGEMTLVFGFLPPELGGGGANAGTNRLNQTVLPRPYAGMNITGTKGLTDAQRQTLTVLGAKDRTFADRPQL
jgi:hypothetical protein